mmetsp:Transcript_34587/g.79974  ORF Transcript_34587/g.79974 Transcript_34587/m.79974 type:complete len:277 (+) Transcript_34587:132-962(+)
MRSGPSMRSHNNLFPERSIKGVIFRQGFRFGDVKSSLRDLPSLKRGDKFICFHDLPSSYVHQDGRTFHSFKLLFADHAGRRRRDRWTEHDYIASWQHSHYVFTKFRSQFAFHFRRLSGTAAVQRLHVEALGPRGHFRANVSQPHDSHSGSRQFHSEPIRIERSAVPSAFHPFDHVSRRRQQKRHAHVRRRVSHHAGGIAARHVQMSRPFQIYVLVSGPKIRHHFQLRQRAHQRPGHAAVLIAENALDAVGVIAQAVVVAHEHDVRVTIELFLERIW